MKMKKRAAALLSLLLALTLPLCALAQGAAPDTMLEGFVTELMEDGFLMEDKELGEILLNTSDATVYDGVLLESELEVGMYVFVTYDGRTTRSVPPQAHADKVSCYVLNGSSAGMAEPGVMLMEDELLGEVLVHLGSESAHVYPDVPVTVYYDGVMAMSLPGQVSARCVIVPQLEGVVSDLDGEGFTLTDDTGAVYRVRMEDMTLIGVLGAAEADEAIMAEDAPIDLDETIAADGAQVDVDETIAAEDAEAGLAEQGADQAEDTAEENFNTVNAACTLEDGDRVTVYFNGELTEDGEGKPAVLTALEVLIHKEEE